MSGNYEDFWNNTNTSSFNFDDDQEQEKLNVETLDVCKPSSFVTSLEDESTLSTLPIFSVLSKSNLSAVLVNTDMALPTVLPIQDTIINMYLGKPYTLGIYRSLQQKLELLDGAILMEDGNIIMSVLLYIRRTLDCSRFYEQLSKRKIALWHYSNYLLKELNFEELSQLYMYVGNYVDIVYLFYLESKDVKDKKGLLYKLSKFLEQHDQNLDNHTRFLFLEYKKFTDWQIENQFGCNSPNEQLAELFKTECNSNNEKRMIEFKELLKISDFPYDWINLNVLCALQLWPKLTSRFIKQNWISKKNGFKSVIYIELFISRLYGHNSPRAVLNDFLYCMPKGEESVVLARRLNCHKYVIDFHLSRKDRQSIINYMDYLPHLSEDYVYAKNLLQDADQKWRN